MSGIRISALAVMLLQAVASGKQASVEDQAALASRAMQLQGAGDYSGAAAVYRELLKLDPNQVATHVNLGVVLVNSGHYDEALVEYAAAEKLLPGDPRILLNTALAYEKSGRIKEAGTRFEALHSSLPQDSKITMLLADCNLQMGEDTRVIELLLPLRAQTPDDLGIAYMLGMAYLRTQQTEEGQKLLNQILRNGDSAESRFLLGIGMFESHDYPAAVKQLQSAIELNSSLPGLQSFYGLALLNTGDPDAAAVAFRKELATNANDYAANLGLGQILLVRKQLSDAVPMFQRALLLRPGSAEAEVGMAQCLSKSGHLQEARPYAEEAARVLPTSRDAHAALLQIYSGLRLKAQADRENHIIQSLMAASAAEAGGPKRDETAPDFDLPKLTSGKRVHLSDYAGKSPVVLVFGSYSCPNFRASAQSLAGMQQRYGKRVAFLLVYIREAHSTDKWQSTRNEREGVNLPPAANMAEKEDHASMCSRKLHLNFPAVVDTMDGATETAYNAWPSRAFIISEDRRVLYSTRLTELEFHADEMELVLRQLSGE